MTPGLVLVVGWPCRLLFEVGALVYRVRLDPRMSWAALLVLAAVMLAGISWGLRAHGAAPQLVVGVVVVLVGAVGFRAGRQRDRWRP